MVRGLEVDGHEPEYSQLRVQVAFEKLWAWRAVELAEMHARVQGCCEMSHAYVLFRGDNAWDIKSCQYILHTHCTQRFPQSSCVSITW